MTSPDEEIVRRASRRMGLWIASAAAIVVLVVMVASLAIVLRQVSLTDLFAGDGSPEAVDIEGRDLLVGVAVVGLGAIVLAGVLALLATRRSVRPLVEALERQRRFVADASHELRTPLAVLDTRLQAAQRAMADDDRHRALIDDLRRDTRGLIDIVSDLLEGIESAPVNRAAPIPLDPVIQNAAGSLNTLAGLRGVSVHADPVPSDVQVRIPETALLRALNALLDNAVAHSPDGDEVRVEVIMSGQTVSILVIDRGPGIQGIDPARMFDRFVTSAPAYGGGGSSRHGFGLGLALVRETAMRYAGEVAVAQTSALGTTIRLTLPRA